MPSDFKKKEPTKNEQMFYDMAMSMDMIDRRLWTTSSFVTALAILAGIDPEKIARLLTTDMSKVQEFSKTINDAISKIETEEKAKLAPSGTEPESHDHSDHTGHNH
jgi:hypothetical protein